MRPEINSLESKSVSFQEKYLLFGILAIGLVLRLVGIHYGLPFNYHADEQLEINQAMGFGTGDFNPHFFKLPPLVTYLLFPFYGALYLAGHILGWFPNPDSFLDFFLKDPSIFYLIARVVFGALTGVLGIGLLFLLAKRFFNVRVAVAASFLLAVNFLHVRDGHFFYLDIPLLAILTGGLYVILGLLEEGKASQYLWAGFFVGLAAAMKYNGAWLAVPYAAAHFIRNWKDPQKLFFYGPLWLSGIICIATFFALNPFALLDWNFFLKEGIGQLSTENSPGLFHHLTYSLTNGLGWGLTVLSLAGIVFGIFKRDRRIWIISLWIVSYYLLLAKGSQPHDRYVLPLIPFMILTAAWLLDQIKISGVIFGVLVFLFGASNLVKSSLTDYLLLQKDTRTVARETLMRELPADSTVALGEPYFFAPRLSRSKKQLESMSSGLSSVKAKRLAKLAESSEKGFALYFLNDSPNNETSYTSTRPQITIDALKKSGVQFAVIPKLRDVRLADGARLIARFSPYRDAALTHSMDSLIYTATPSSWKELLARKSFGEIIEVYEIQ